GAGGRSCGLPRRGVPLELLGEEVGPGAHLGMLLEQGPTLALGHAAPHTELDAVVQCVRPALEQDRAVTADRGRLALGGTADEELVGVDVSTAGLGHPLLAALPEDRLLRAERVAGPGADPGYVRTCGSGKGGRHRKTPVCVEPDAAGPRTSPAFWARSAWRTHHVSGTTRRVVARGRPELGSFCPAFPHIVTAVTQQK